MTQIRQ